MKLIHIVGRKNHGKTTLVTALLEEFRRRGIRVGSIKHSPHVHELDTPGKDSHRHRLAGASPVAVVTSDLLGVYIPRTGDEFLNLLAPLFAPCRLVLVEGFVDGPGKKIEVWRAERQTTPLALEHDDIAAVVSDDQPDVTVPVWPRSDVTALVDRILDLADST
ncbi:MAG: molybdopterin-guanine dinucleotide biosynthesis protein B [Planctomycetota bacterium]|nr:MAG: molybdopterin-guanine dinucleotide biosynthesis protein B [Planctomycetota bacterium]